MRKKSENKKGFTLAELLVVVAIIAVLVAIAIPIFGDSLEKAAESADLANVRSAYAELTVKYLEDKSIGGTAAGTIQVPATQTQTSWQIDNDNGKTPIGTTFTGGSTEEVEVPYKIKPNKYKVIIDTAGDVTVE